MADFRDRVRETLRRCQREGELVEIYDDAEDLQHLEVGLVESVTHETYSILSVGPYGDLDGRQVGRIDEVARLATGSAYLSALRLLHEGRRSGRDEGLPSADGYLPMDLANSLRYARDSQLVVSLVDPDRESLVGFVKDFGSEWVELLEIRRDGEEDGTILVHLDDVIRIDVGGRTEQARHFVHRVRMGL